MGEILLALAFITIIVFLVWDIYRTYVTHLIERNTTILVKMLQDEDRRRHPEDYDGD